MKYLVVDSIVNKGVYDESVVEFEELSEAIKYADSIWNSTCDSDKKECNEYYILKSANPDEESEDHYDGDYIMQYKANIMSFAYFFTKNNLTIKGISDRFEIPYRTVQNWANGQRECPVYIIKMMDEILRK